MLVDSCAGIDYDVKEALSPEVSYGFGMRQKTLRNRLNVRPNPYMDISTFRRLLFLDLFMEGYAAIYYDASSYSLYHMAASQLTVVLDDKKYINHFTYGGDSRQYRPDEIIFIKDNAYWTSSISSTGFSRVSSALETIKKLNKVRKFKENFYDNGAVLGLIIETESLLSKKRKMQYEEDVAINHNPRTGKSNVLVLDGGFKAKSVANTNFKDLGVIEEISEYKESISTALGVPPVLFSSGNNANIKPNVELFYNMTVMPTVKKVEKALEFFFNYDIKVDTSDVAALAPDRDAQSKWITSLVNNGLITGDEGREELRRPPIGTPDMTNIRIPQNIAGSGTGVTGQEGGKPVEGEN